MSNDLDDLTYNLLCNRQKTHHSKSYFIKKDEEELDIPIINENNEIIKIIIQKLNNKNIKNSKLDEITDNLLVTCIQLIKFNLSNIND
jgi:hypothetical protein